MEYKGYTARIEFDEEDMIFVGRVEGLRDIIGFHGRDARSLKKNFYEAIDCYLDACAKSGTSPDKPFSGKFNLRVPAQLHRELAAEAECNNLSLNELVIRKLRGTKAA